MSDTNQNTEQTIAPESNNVPQGDETPVVDVDTTNVEASTEASNTSTVETSSDNSNQNDTGSSPESGSENESEARPTFEVQEESESDEEDEEVDLSKYTVLDADNLDEDDPIPGQEYALFSFMSPEGIMNCNVRAFKFRGAFPSIEKATEYAETLKKKDKYFKIHCGESGKWVEFDPPEEHVEKVVAGNKKQQKIIDAQRKARMDKMNELAGRHKQKIDKTDRGAKSRIEESKKAGAAEDYVNKNRSNTQAKKASKAAKAQKQQARSNSRSSRSEAMRERLRKKLEAKQAKEQEQKAKHANKRRLEKTRDGEREQRVTTTEERFQSGQVDENDLKRKTQVVNKASADLESKKSELARTNANIDKIRKMMNKN